MSDSLFQFFWKNSSRHLFSSSPIFSLFLIYFEWLKTWWVHQLVLYKTSLYSRGKDTKIKDVKHEILICFKSPIVEHWSPLTPNTPNLAHSFIKLRDVFSIGSTRWSTKNVLWASESEEQCVRSGPHLNFQMFAHWPIYPTIPAFYWQGFFPKWSVTDVEAERPGWHTRFALVQLSPLNQLFSSSNGFVHCPSSHYILFLMEPNKQTCSWFEQICMSCTSASEQSQSPAVRVAAVFFGVAEWTFSWACVLQALCVNSAFLLQQSSHHGKNFT